MKIVIDSLPNRPLTNIDQEKYAVKPRMRHMISAEVSEASEGSITRLSIFKI